MFNSHVAGYLGSDAQKTEKGCSFSVSHNYKEKGVDKTLWITCFINYETRVFDFLKKGTYVIVDGRTRVSTFQKENGDVVACVALDVKDIELGANKSKE